MTITEISKTPILKPTEPTSNIFAKRQHSQNSHSFSRNAYSAQSWSESHSNVLNGLFWNWNGSVRWGTCVCVRVCVRALCRQRSAHTLCGLNSYFWCNFTGSCGMHQRCVKVCAQTVSSRISRGTSGQFHFGRNKTEATFRGFDFQSVPTVNENIGGISCEGSWNARKIPNH